jgi:hypothetical protein
VSARVAPNAFWTPIMRKREIMFSTRKARSGEIQA